MVCVIKHIPRSKVNKNSEAYALKAIRTKWVYRNKKDERGVVVRNKERLVSQGHRQEEGIDYDEVFAHVARIKAIRIFLAFASYMGFIVYQMDVKSVFLYGTIDEEVQAKDAHMVCLGVLIYKHKLGFRAYLGGILPAFSRESRVLTLDKSLNPLKSRFLQRILQINVSQPLSFVDPKFPNKVYKVVKALYGLHQASRVWYATLSTFLEKSGYRKGAIDKSLFIKKDKKDIMLVQVYVDDIIFGSTKKSWCDEFEELMKNRLQMSSMSKLTFFLGLQVKQKEDGIFISQDKYVPKILKKFDFLSVNTASTSIETQKPLVKDEEATDVDVHLYRSMISSLRYLTASKPDIMFAVCACSRFQAQFIRNAYKKKLIQVLKIHIDDNVADLLIQKQTVSGKDFSNPFMADQKMYGIQLTMLHSKELASLKQTSLGKDISNPFMADRLPKTTLPTSTMASVIICLATNQKFNFSMYILLSLVKNIEAGVPFFMFPRFVQLLIDHQLGDMSHHKDIYDNPSLTKKVFSDMKRVGIGFYGVVTPLFDYMFILAAKEVGLIQDDVQSISIPIEPSTSKPHKKHKPKKQQTQAPKVSSPEPSPERRLPSPSNDPLPGDVGLDLSKLAIILNRLRKIYSKRLTQRIVPFFDSMIIQQGEGSGTPTESHHTPSQEAQPSSPTHISSSSIPTVIPIPTVTQSEPTPLRQYTRRVRIAQSFALLPIADEPASPARDVSKGEAFPTDSGFITDQDRATIAKSSTLPHDTKPRVTSPAAVEGTQEVEINKLKARVKILEDNQGVIRARSADDTPIKGRRIDEEEEEMATVLTSMDATTVLASGTAKEIPTGSGSIPTAGVEVPTGSDVVPTASRVFATATVVTPYSRRKGKKVMVESDTPKKQRLQEQIDARIARELEEQLEREHKRMSEQKARDAEVVRIHAEEELKSMIDGLDRNNETIAKYLQEYQQFAAELPLERRIELISDLVKYQENYAKIYKFQSQQRRLWTKKQKRDYYMAVIRNNLGWKVKDFKGMTFEEMEAKFNSVYKQMEDFIPMGSKEEAERYKRKAIRFDQESSKKLKSSEEIIEEAKSTDEIPKEKIKEMMQLIPIEEVYVEALQVKHPIIDWKVHNEGQRSYWKIIRLGGSSAYYQFFVDLLKHLDREDLNQL
nr:hypothetical protein [Tanacetum cinerariifolium]